MVRREITLFLNELLRRKAEMMKENNTINHFQRWLIMAPLGLSIIGFGACLVAEAAMAKYAGESWFWAGTLALVVLNTGVCLVGTAVVHRVHYELGRK